MNGGTLELDFGYGSRYDDAVYDPMHEVSCQGCICDDCIEKKHHLLRSVVKRTTVAWNLAQ